jgi:hypothetical protein
MWPFNNDNDDVVRSKRKKVSGIPLSVNKFSEYCLKRAEIARKQERVALNAIDAVEMRRLLRRIIVNFEREHDVTVAKIDDDKIIPLVMGFYNCSEPVHLELIFVVLYILLCVESGYFEHGFAMKMARSIERRCNSIMDRLMP